MYAVQVKNLCKSYHNNVEALKNLNFNINRGEFLCLLGKNGAGKTTFVQVLSSLVNLTSGKVAVFGKDLIKDNDFVKSKIGLVPQEFNLAMFEGCFQILVTQAGYYGIPYKQAAIRAEELLKELNLWHKKDSKSMELSGGMKRRLMIARALMHNPDIIFFDEPTAGIDIEVRQVVWKIMQKLNQKGKTIILTTHYFEEAEKLCETLAILDKGKIIVHDNLKEILNKFSKQIYHFKIMGEIKDFIAYHKDLNIKLLSKNDIEITIKEDLDYVLSELSKAKIRILKVNLVNSGLEDYFLKIVK